MICNPRWLCKMRSLEGSTSCRHCLKAYRFYPAAYTRLKSMHAMADRSDRQADGTACVRAADEVVWRCYRRFSSCPRSKTGATRAASHIEPTFSPCANLDKCRVG